MKIRNILIPLFLAGCAVLAFILRLGPIEYLAGTGNIIGGPDVWYHFARIDFNLQTGSDIAVTPFSRWGYLTGMTGFFATEIYTFVANFAGTVTQIEIIDACSWIPPVCGALICIPAFFIARRLTDWKGGLIAAAFMAVVGGQVFARTMYGYIDHHCIEIILAAVFCAVYVAGLVRGQKNMRAAVLWGCVSGVVYALCLHTMPSMLFFCLFIGVFSVVLFCAELYYRRVPFYLFALNVCTFGIAGVLMAAECISVYGLSSFPLPAKSLACFAAVAGMVFLLFIARFAGRVRSPLQYALGVLVPVLVFAGVVVCCPSVVSVIADTAVQWVGVSGGSANTGVVTEYIPWSLPLAFASFNWLLVLAVGGLVVAGYWVLVRHNVAALFVVVSSVGLLGVTCVHVRWEYYLALFVVVLAALFVRVSVGKLLEVRHMVFARVKDSRNVWFVVGGFSVLLGVMAFGMSVGYDMDYTDGAVDSAGDADWMEACEWLRANSPELSLGVYDVYSLDDFRVSGGSRVVCLGDGSELRVLGVEEVNPLPVLWSMEGNYPLMSVDVGEDVFAYPAEGNYSVLSWSSYGFYIWAIGHRIPVTNPGWGGLEDVYGAAEILCYDGDEDGVRDLLRFKQVKYIMVDGMMAEHVGVMGAWLHHGFDEGEAFVVRLYEGNVPDWCRLVYVAGNVKVFEVVEA